MSLTARRPNISTVAKPTMPPKIPKKVIAPLRVIAISPKQSIKRPLALPSLKGWGFLVH